MATRLGPQSEEEMWPTPVAPRRPALYNVGMPRFERLSGYYADTNQGG